jgi:hypothetical protein
MKMVDYDNRPEGIAGPLRRKRCEPFSRLMVALTSAPAGPPRRIDGYTIGAISTREGPGPHGGEVHPDGDEFLYVASGTMESHPCHIRPERKLPSPQVGQGVLTLGPPSRFSHISTRSDEPDAEHA